MSGSRARSHVVGVIAFCAGLAAGLLPAAARADVLRLKAGATLRGDILSEADDEIVFREWGEAVTLTFQRPVVASISRDKPPASGFPAAFPEIAYLRSVERIGCRSDLEKYAFVVVSPPDHPVLGTLDLEKDAFVIMSPANGPFAVLNGFVDHPNDAREGWKRLRVIDAPAYSNIRGAPACPQAITAYVPLLVGEWSLYPPDLFRKAGLKRLVLCEELTNSSLKVGAVPDFENGDLYLDVSHALDSRPYSRKAIHHDFFHMIDRRDDGSLKDPEWAALNPKGTAYGTGGWDAIRDGTASGVLTSDIPGFLNRYSTSGVEEDKAEVFSNMIVNRDVVDSMAKKDAVLRSKVQKMEELVHKFCPAVGAEFWEAAAKLKRQ